MFKSSNGGADWSWLRSGLFHSTQSGVASYPEIYEIVIDPQDEDIIYAATVSQYTGGVYKSIDGGQNWSRKTSGIDNTFLDCIAIDSNNPSVLYVGVDGSAYANLSGGIYKSINSGESWSKLTNLPIYTDESRFEKIVLSGTDTIYTLGVNYNDFTQATGLIKSTNGGENWTKISPNGTYIRHFDATDNVIYALEVETTQIFKSTDEGTSWITKSVPYTGGTIKISPHDDNTIFYSNGTAILKSSDGLNNITQVFTLGTSSSLFDMEFASSDPNLIYLAIAHYLIYKSTDGGDTFALIADLRNFIDNY